MQIQIQLLGHAEMSCSASLSEGAALCGGVLSESDTLIRADNGDAERKTKTAQSVYSRALDKNVDGDRRRKTSQQNARLNRALRHSAFYSSTATS